MLFNKDGVVFI